jgi:hypothetical protein
MSDFDKADWMQDNHVRPGKVWETFRNTKPFPEFCDIRLKNNLEIGPCWPRIKDNDFMDLSSDNEDSYLFSDVKNVRYYLPIKSSARDNDVDEDDEEGEKDDEDDDRTELDDLIPSRICDELHDDD